MYKYIFLTIVNYIGPNIVIKICGRFIVTKDCFILKIMRNNDWLEARLEHIYKTYFPDLEAPNAIEIAFGKRAARTLGSIRKSRYGGFWGHLAGNYSSIITISGYFRDETIPDFVVDGVIAHELSHYAHGFNSPLPQKFRHPHKGGVIKSELKNRGLNELEIKQKKWLRDNWAKYLKQNHLNPTKRQRIIVK